MLKRERKNSRWDEEWIIQKPLTLPPSKPGLFWRAVVQFVPEVLIKDIRLLTRDHIASWSSNQITAQLHCPSHPRNECIFLDIFLMFFCASASPCHPNSGSVLPDAVLTLALMLLSAFEAFGVLMHLASGLFTWVLCKVSVFLVFQMLPDGQQCYMAINNNMSCSAKGERKRGGREGGQEWRKEGRKRNGLLTVLFLVNPRVTSQCWASSGHWALGSTASFPLCHKSMFTHDGGRKDSVWLLCNFASCSAAVMPRSNVGWAGDPKSVPCSPSCLSKPEGRKGHWLTKTYEWLVLCEWSLLLVQLLV